MGKSSVHLSQVIMTKTLRPNVRCETAHADSDAHLTSQLHAAADRDREKNGDSQWATDRQNDTDSFWTIQMELYAWQKEQIV